MATPKKKQFKGKNEIQEVKEHFESIRGSLLIHVYLYVWLFYRYALSERKQVERLYLYFRPLQKIYSSIIKTQFPPFQ